MIKKKLPVQLILLFAILFSFNSLVTSKVALSSQNKTANKTANQAAKKASAIPKLTVLLVVDQFRADYLTRLKGLFGQKGFNRLINQGANFTNAHYAYSNTYTAVGHTTIVTGSLPSIHGIVANKWFDRKENRLVRASEDDKTTPLGGKEGASPQQLLTTTFGDQLRLSNNYQSKSIGISIKERSAVFIAGRRATGAYWFDGSQGNMSSSSYFMKELPEWVIKFNKEGFADEYFQKSWDRKLPIEAYNIADKDDASYEGTWKGNTITFPHIIDGNSKEKGPAFYRQFGDTPFSNDMLTKFALAAIDNENLGKDEYPDFLAVSFSAPDLIGHMFGPYSHEAQDIMLRLDDTIGNFLDQLDKRFGLNNLLIVLTADHGVSPIPEYAQAHNLGGGRIDGLALKAEMEKLLVKEFGKVGNDKYILALINHQFYLNEELIKEKKLSLTQISEFLGQEAAKTKGVSAFYTKERILTGRMPDTDISRRIMAGYSNERCGNVFLLVEPFVLIAEAEDEYVGTSHGTPYHYDTHVPIIMMGSQVKPGVYKEACTPSDIAPTLANLLSVEAPSGSVGRVLTEALK